MGDNGSIQIVIQENEDNYELDGILTYLKEEELIENNDSKRNDIVVFAHGSGSGRQSPRNQYVASVLHDSGIGTLLVDLLTSEEQRIDEKTREHRFNIKLLANRLSAVTNWLLTKNKKTKNTDISIGYFGASTGAAAALIAASEESHAAGVIKAIVSRGGRPDLVHSSHLKKVQAATLFLVGSRDNGQVISLNQKAMKELKNAREKRLVMIPGAGHLFEEPGTLEEAARYAASWFEKYL
jgi:putative phosphoribosyl transferase